MYIDLQFGETITIDGVVENHDYDDYVKTKSSYIPAQLKISNKSFKLSFNNIIRITSVDNIGEINCYNDQNKSNFYICGTNFKCDEEQFNQLLKVMI